MLISGSPVPLESPDPASSPIGLVATDLEPPRLQRNSDDFAAVRDIVESGHDRPVLMVNLNRYRPGSGFPDSGDYHEYVTNLGPFLHRAGGARIVWRTPVLGSAVGDQRIDEILAVWYPSHKVFLDLYEAPGAAANFALKARCVEYAVIHRCPGDLPLRAPDGRSH